MNIYQISTYIFNHTGHLVETSICNGIYSDDTIEVRKVNGSPYLALSFDPTDDSFILGTLWYRHGYGENGGFDDEPLEEGLCWSLDDEDDTDTLDEICRYADQNL
ncbi:hypothetical protein [Bifidobacterium vansinderenii]|uniref:Uncharacterized protein n=1 Tax=Bifidobacterium vansinderenii TaxID=1984871 RepID=A0A229VYN4_9BIFI|nr:hypothetical protein [Bifidobacterium vansinderenii]OXN00510.1 hypothetical protein Tam10B_1380 [Bifidobacterium vansinderenii]